MSQASATNRVELRCVQTEGAGTEVIQTSAMPDTNACRQHLRNEGRLALPLHGGGHGDQRLGRQGPVDTVAGRLVDVGRPGRDLKVYGSYPRSELLRSRLGAALTKTWGFGLQLG